MFRIVEVRRHTAALTHIAVLVRGYRMRSHELARSSHVVGSPLAAVVIFLPFGLIAPSIAAIISTRHCPNCNAMYQVVKTEAGPETDNRQITCRACGAPLVGREGKSILKYFLLRDGGRFHRGRVRRFRRA